LRRRPIIDPDGAGLQCGRCRVVAATIIFALLGLGVLAHNLHLVVLGPTAALRGFIPRTHDHTEVTDPATQPLLQAIEISKRFGDLLANDAVSVDLMPHEIHALLGENGAGKSTLVKIMYGLIQPSSGELRWQGEKAVLVNPAHARALGIGMVFQHFSLFENLTVAENVALGLPPGEPFARISARLAEVSRAYGLPLEPQREVWRLSVGERQRIEIVRALMQNPKLLILDEPTAVLTPGEAEQLFAVLRRLKQEGRAILYISHKLEEVKQLCDTATILRAGKKVATCDPRRETAASLARMMVGADVGPVHASAARSAMAPRLVVRDLLLEPDDPHGTRLRSVSLEVRGGEVLGIAGVAGNGQDELFAALSGERASPLSGNVVVDGDAVGIASVTERRRRGAAFVPDERLGHATAPRMPLSENALLTGHAASGMVRHGFIKRPVTLALVDRVTAAFDVRKAKRNPEPMSLSGGNLQKFVVGREILREPGVLVVNQPTWGVDAGATAVIRQALIDLARRGSAVLVISQDLDELLEIADRIAVMFHGSLSEPLDKAAASRERLGLLMGGSNADDRTATGASDAIHA
jgi:simple sugar transport system ATP-binding protein